MEVKAANGEILLTKMKCPVYSHEENDLILFCIDPCCNSQNKIGCIDCLYDFHDQHKTVKLKNIELKINEKIKNDLENEELILENKIKSIEENILLSVEHLRTDILEILNNKTTKFVEEVKNKLINNNQKTFDINKLKVNEFKMLSKEDQIAFIELIKDNYIHESNKNESKNRYNHEIIKFENSFKQNFSFISKQIREFLNCKLFGSINVLFNESAVFEWSDKTYANYGFLYTLSNNNCTATKSLNDGTITMLRSSQKLEEGKIYITEFAVEIKKGGDFDIGIGNDSVGSNCWIRAIGGYGVSNMGIYSNGRVIDSNKKLSDEDTIILEVDLKLERVLKIRKIGTFLQEVKLDVKPPLYFFCAVRKVGNSVTVKNFIINE